MYFKGQNKLQDILDLNGLQIIQLWSSESFDHYLYFKVNR